MPSMRPVAVAVSLLLGLACAGVVAEQQPQAATREELQWSACTIPRRPQLSTAEFVAEFKGKAPVVFSGAAGNQQAFKQSLQRDAIEAGYGDFAVVTASSNSYSHDKRDMTMRSYLQHHMQPQSLDSLANETWYLFGDTFGPQWDELLREYRFPVDSRSTEGISTFGLGGRFSGVSFHTHGAAFGESIIGSKRWYLSPPQLTPDFRGDESQLFWVSTRFPHEPELQPLVCTVVEGEVIYIASAWHHATLNMQHYNAFVSVFTREQP